MPTKAQGVPVEEMQACARSCAAWLVAKGFTTGPAEPEVLLFSLAETVNESVPGGLVLSIFYWLWCTAMAPVDGRRAAEKARAEANPELPRDTGDLRFGNTEHELAGKIRGIIRTIELLGDEVELVAERQRAQVVFKRQNDGTATRRAFHAWRTVGQALQRLVEPTGLRAIPAMQVPHTLDDWRRCRLNIELTLYEAKFTNTEISKLMPGGGGAKAVFQRRNYALNVDLGVPAIEHRPNAGGKAPSVTADGDQSRTAEARRNRGAGTRVGQQRAPLDKNRATRKHSPRPKTPRPPR